jgi:DNA-binding transcriptional ArsR family regulator
MSYQAVLEALGDGTRRQILERLRSGPHAVGQIAQGLPVSRPAVSRHLRVLEAVGLVTHEPSGTKNLYRADPRGLREVRAWLDGYWDDALSAFAGHVQKTGKGRH